VNNPLTGKVTVNQALIDFNTVDVGSTSTPQTITVTVSVAAVAINPTVTGPGFALASSTCAASQAPGTCAISVKFSPATVGGASGVLTVGGGVSVSLNGTGTTPGVFTAPDRIDLLTVKVGAAVPVSVQIAPQGTVAGITCTSGSAAELAPSPTTTTCSATAAISAPCVFGFTFNATTAGSRNVNVTCSGGNKTTITTVAANVVGPAVLVVSQSSALFSAVVGKTDSAVITVSNNGGSATVAAPAVSIASGAADFAITANDCVVALAPLGTCKVTVTFSPTTGGSKTGSLSVTDGTNPLAVTLTGTATTGAGVAITPNPADFGTVAIGNSKPTVFTVKNTGGTATGVIAVAGGSSEFVVSSDLCTGTALVATTGQCTFTATFVPAAPAGTAAHQGIITVGDASGLLASVKVQGVAQAAVVGVVLSIDPPTLDFGTPASAWPSAPRCSPSRIAVTPNRPPSRL